MPLSIQTFIGAMGAGGARPNQFRVNIYGTGAVPAPFPDQSFLCNAASLPGQTINPCIVMYRGREVKFAGDRVYSPWTVSFYNDGGMRMRDYLEAWMHTMDGRANKLGFTAPQFYWAAADVEQLDRNGGVLRSYRMEGLYPVELSEVGLDYGANDQVSTSTVTFQYNYMMVIPGSGPQQTEEGPNAPQV